MKHGNMGPRAPISGGASLLVAFAALCLVTFATLGLASVQADSRLYSGVAAMPPAYYAADVEANRVLADIRAGEIPDDVVRSGEVYTWSTPVTDELALYCEVLVRRPDYEIQKWALERSTPWEGDFGMEVFVD